MLELEVVPRSARIRIAELEAQVKVLTRRVAELEARLRQNSTNTSKPPSSDPPGVRRPPEPTGRRPGGQPGHESHTRELLPPEQVDRFIEVPAPERCTSCNEKLEGGQRQVLRHQMVEIPPLKPLVTEFLTQGAVIRRILRHLHLPECPAVLAPVRGHRSSSGSNSQRRNAPS